jgi:hypothetical protein
VIFSKPDRKRALANIEGIFSTVLKILERSRDEGKPPADIAEEMAAARIRKGEMKISRNEPHARFR